MNLHASVIQEKLILCNAFKINKCQIINKHKSLPVTVASEAVTIVGPLADLTVSIVNFELQLRSDRHRRSDSINFRDRSDRRSGSINFLPV